ncbi:MAG: cation:proton antiporter [Phascolarctobacterium sp.]|nr:cation:proton antiporter [Phascolarctobacterium sp.]
MEGLNPLLIDLALILIVAGVTTVLFKKLNQPIVLGYVVAGFLTGPNFKYIPTVMDNADVKLWSEIGVIFLMFAIGLEFSFAKLKKVGVTAAIALFFIVTGMVGLGYLCGTLLGWKTMDCVFLGGMLSMSSTAIIVKAFDDLKLKGLPFTDVCLGILIVEDILGIIMLVLVSTMGQTQGKIDPNVLLTSITRLVIFLTFCFVAGVWFIPTLFQKIGKLLSDETLLVFSLGLCLGMVWLAVYLGFSSALGAFLMGSLLAETHDADKIEEIIQPVKNLFSAVFFVSVGMMVDPQILVQYLVPVLCIVCVVIGGQIIFATCGVIASGHNLKTAMLCAFSLTQIGEFSFIVAEQGSHYALTSDFLYPIIVAVSVITTFTTPFFVKLAEPAHALLEKHLPEKIKKLLVRYTEREEKSAYDSAWQDFLVNYCTRLLVYSVLLVIASILTCIYLAPFLANMYGTIGEWAAGAIATLIIAPILAKMLHMSGQLRSQYSTLYFKKRVNRIPLEALRLLRIFIAWVAIYTILEAILPIESIYAKVLSVLACVGIYQCDTFLNYFNRLEAGFLVNLNQKHVKQHLDENGEALFPFDEDFKTGVYALEDASMLIGKTLLEVNFGKYYGCNVLRVFRADGEVIDMPAGKTKFETGDSIRVVGDSQQYVQFQAANVHDRLGLCVKEEPISLKDYMLEMEQEDDPFYASLVVVPKNYEWVGKTIKTSNIKTEINALVIGLQRGKYTFSNPNLDMVIQGKDALWLLGKEDSCNILTDRKLL